MPLYDYRCPQCEFTYSDIFFKLEDYAETHVLRCPRHGLTSFVQVLTPPAVDDWGNCSDGKHFEDLAPRGMNFRDKKSFKAYLRKEGLRERNSYVD